MRTLLAFVGLSLALPLLPARSLAAEVPVAAEVAYDRGVTAFVGVNVLPMDRERVLAGQTVLVREGRIVQIGPAGSVRVPSDARVIQAEGRFLLPALIDSHAHLIEPELFPLYLANGIGTVLNMNGSPEVLKVRAQVSRGELPGPRVVTTGPLVAGEEIRWKNRVLVRDTNAARETVRAQRAAGYDFIKVYEGLTAESYAALVDEARRQGLRAIGHVPDAPSWEAVLAGQARIDHAGTLIDRSGWPEIEPARFKQIAVELARAGVWVCPTLALYGLMERSATDAGLQSLESRPEMRYVPAATLAWWRQARPTPGTRYGLVAFFGSRLVSELNRAGVRILVGTDHQNPFVVPGFAIHDEIDALAAASMTPYEALRSATALPAEFLRGEFGVVEVGRAADLLLVQVNPLADLGTLRHPEGLMLRGRWFSRADLEAGLAALGRSPQ